jgi:hypothetical protein
LDTRKSDLVKLLAGRVIHDVFTSSDDARVVDLVVVGVQVRTIAVVLIKAGFLCGDTYTA